MTQEEKQLLLKDLCARLFYGVKAKLCDGVKRGLTYLSYFMNPPVKDDKCDSYIEAKYYGN